LLKRVHRDVAPVGRRASTRRPAPSTHTRLSPSCLTICS